MSRLSTGRLLLRPLAPSDVDALAAMNADSRVMQYLPGVLSREESEAMVERIAAHWERHGFGAWALEAPGSASFVGLAGLGVPTAVLPCGPCIEILWRLAFEHWGRGYATEAARAILEFGFRQLRIEEIVSFTVPANARSRAVMERLGMSHSERDDFDHPGLPDDHPLRRHVLYRLARSRWERGEASPRRCEV